MFFYGIYDRIYRYEDFTKIPHRIFNFLEIKMEPKDYIVEKIDGEYANLKDTETNEELFIAMALLPLSTDIGTRLHYENLEYTITY